MRKRLLIPLISLIALFLVSTVTIWYNLKAHSVYYARHIPHKEGENPELAFIIDNLLFIPKTYDQFEYNELSHEISPEQGKILRPNFLGYQEGYMIFNSKKISYVWDKSGRFDFYMEYHSDEKMMSKEHATLAEQELHDIIDPIIEVQKEPTLNLQWLFNWVHRERFNK